MKDKSDISKQSCTPLQKNFFGKTFVQYVTVWLVRIWTYKNADEKAHTFSRRSKNVKKRTKTYEKRILCKFTFNHIFEILALHCFAFTALAIGKTFTKRNFLPSKIEIVSMCFSIKI